MTTTTGANKPRKTAAKAVSKPKRAGNLKSNIAVKAIPPVDPRSLEELRSDDAEQRALALVDIMGNALPAIPNSFHYRLGDVDRVKNAFDFTFALIGGQPAFALWAAQNPSEFYKLYSKLLPTPQNAGITANGPVTIITNVPDSPLDTAMQVVGQVYDINDADELE